MTKHRKNSMRSDARGDYWIYLQWTVVLVLGVGGFAFACGLVHAVSGVPVLSLLVGVFAGGLVSFSVHTATRIRLYRHDPAQHP